MSGGRLALAAVVASTLLSATAATPATRPGTLSITPSLIEAVLPPRSRLVPIAVRNGSLFTFRIRVYPALVRQSLDGSLVIKERRRQLAAARRLFLVRPRRLVLRPGGLAVLRQRFRRAPQGRPAAYGATVVEAVLPRTRKQRGATFRLRLLGALLVTKPNAPRPRGRLVRVHVVQLGPRRLGFCARLSNTGRVHGYPEGLRLTVRRRRGPIVFSAAPRRGVVLPGFRRDFTVQRFRLLPRGRYVVEARGRFGARTVRRTALFRLVAPNRLPVRAGGKLGCVFR
jgi:hypothetical protein